MAGRSSEDIKAILSTKEALGMICFNKHNHSGKVNCTRLSELLKTPINKLKETCSKLEELKIIKMQKIGQDYEVELLEHEDQEINQLIDEIIWENKQEYGKIYKRIITAELLDFMGDDK